MAETLLLPWEKLKAPLWFQAVSAPLGVAKWL